MKHLLVTTCLFALSSFAATATGQKPDFSGTWKLDADRSRFDAIKAPKGFTMKIVHQDPKMHVLIHERANDEFDVTTDGAEHAVTINGAPATASALWDDDTHLLLTVKQNGVTTTRRLHLGDKGKMMTSVLSITDDKGEKKGFGFYTKE